MRRVISVKNELRKLPFTHSRGLEVGIDIFMLEELYDRQSRIDHKITDPHKIGFYLLLYIESGSGIHTVDFEPFQVEPHTLAIISKHQINQFDERLPLKGYIILITEEFIHRSLFDLEGAITNLLFEPITTQAHFFNEAKSVLPHIKRLAEEYKRNLADPQQIPILTRELGILLLKAERLRCNRLSEPAQIAETSLRLIAFRDVLEVHFKDHWTVLQYAEELGFSKKTLGSLTRKHLNRSPKEVIDQRLLLEIKRLLAHTDLTIKEIAIQLGFEDPSNINKFFQRLQRMTPTDFRKK